MPINNLRVRCYLCGEETSYALFGKKDDGTPRLCKSCDLDESKSSDIEEPEELILSRQDVYDYYEFIIDNRGE